MEIDRSIENYVRNTDDDNDEDDDESVDDRVLRALTDLPGSTTVITPTPKRGRRRKHSETEPPEPIKRSRSDKRKPKAKIPATNPLNNLADVRDSWTREAGGEYGRQRHREEQDTVRRNARRPIPASRSPSPPSQPSPQPPPNRAASRHQTTDTQKLRERSREELLAERRAIRQQIIERKRAERLEESNAVGTSADNENSNNDTVDRALGLIEYQRQTDELMEQQRRIDQALSEFVDPNDSMPLFRSTKPLENEQQPRYMDPFVGNRGNSVTIIPPARNVGRTKLSALTKNSDPDEEPPASSMSATNNDASSAYQLLTQPTIGIASMSDMQHLRHVMRVIDACTPPDDRNAAGARVWLGLSTFLNYYFASTLQLFLGERVVLRILQIPSTSEFGAKFYVLGNQRYSLMLLADFEYWERLLAVAIALPDIYFENGVNTLARTYQRLAPNDVPRQTPRYRLSTDTLSDYKFASGVGDSNNSNTITVNAPTTVQTSNNETLILRDGNNMNCSLLRRDAETLAAPIAPAPPPPPVANDADQNNAVEQIERQNAESLDMAVASLCLAHRFEMLLEKDFRNKLPNYVTLAKMFTRNSGSVNPFRIDLFSN